MLQFLSFVVGLLLLAYVLFSYETEEKRVSSWLDDAWIYVSDKETTLAFRILGFLRALTSALSNLLDRLYDTKVLSVRAYLSSVCLCAGFAIIVCLYMEIDVDFWLSLVLATCLLCTTLIKDRRIFYLIATLSIAISAYATWRYFEGHDSLNGPMRGADELATLGWALLAASAFDFLCVSVTRRALSISAKTASLAKLLLQLLIIVLTSAVILSSPLGVIYVSLHYFEVLISSTIPIWIYIFSAMSILVVTSIFLMFFLAVFVRLLVGLLPRTLYTTIKFKLLNNRKSTIGMSMFLIGLQFPQASMWMERVAKIVVG